MDDGLDPESYEARTGISKDEYEQRLLEATRYSLMREIGHVDFDEHDVSHGTVRGALRRDGGLVKWVRLEGEGVDTHLVVLFRLDARPGVLFGSRAQIWPAPVPDDFIASPEDLGSLMHVYLEEAVCSQLPESLAGDPDAQGIAWTQPLI